MNKLMLTSFLLISLSSCALGDATRYPANRWLRDDDARPIEMPHKREQKRRAVNSSSDLLEGANEALLYAGDFMQRAEAYTIRSRNEALNVNNFDEVADSTWFTNRVGRYGFSKENVGDIASKLFLKPPSGALKVMGLTQDESSVRMVLADADSKLYLLKLDTSERGAFHASVEMMTGFLLYAMGYNVPPKSILKKFDASMLESGVVGGKPAVEANDLSAAVAKITNARGSVVIIGIPGDDIIGDTLITGTTHGDINDRIRHEHRREIRGLKVISSWVDAKGFGNNSALDVFVRSKGKSGYVMHYALESGRAFNWVYDGAKDGDIFDALTWQPYNFITPFVLATDRDNLWAANLIMSLPDDVIDAMSKLSMFPDDKVRKKVVDGLISRKKAIGRAWLQKLVPIGDVQINGSTSSATLSFSNFCQKYSLEDDCSGEYRYMFISRNFQEDVTGWLPLKSGDALDPSALAKIKGKEFVVRMQFKKAGGDWPSSKLDLYISKQSDGLKLIGMAR